MARARVFNREREEEEEKFFFFFASFATKEKNLFKKKSSPTRLSPFVPLSRSLSHSPRAFCSRAQAHRERKRERDVEKEKKEDLRFFLNREQRERKCREPKFGRSQGKKKRKNVFSSSCGRLNGAFAVRPPPPGKAGHALPA